MLTVHSRYTTITNSLRLSRFFDVRRQHFLPSIPPVELQQVFLCRKIVIHGVIWTAKRPQIERLCACYITGIKCRYYLIFQANVTTYIRMTTKTRLFIPFRKLRCEHIQISLVSHVLADPLEYLLILCSLWLNSPFSENSNVTTPVQADV